MSTGFTGTKFDVLTAVVRHWETASYGPTVEEVRQTVGLQRRSSVQHHINDLIESGLITNIPRRKRTLRPTDKGKSLVALMREIDAEAKS